MLHARRLTAVLLFVSVLDFAQRGRISQQLVFTPDRQGGIYNLGEIVSWTLAQEPAPVTCTYNWTVRLNTAIVLKEWKYDLSAGGEAG